MTNCVNCLRRLIMSISIMFVIGIIVKSMDILIGSNFRTVIPGRVYGCAQPSAESLNKAVAQYGIRTVVNLRGCSSGYSWYDNESRATADLGLNQEDIGLSAGHLPSPDEMRRLLEVLD